MKEQSGSLEKSNNCVKKEDLILQNFRCSVLGNNLDVLKTIEDKDRKDSVKDKDLTIGVLAGKPQSSWCQTECRIRHSGLSNKNELLKCMILLVSEFHFYWKSYHTKYLQEESNLG